jgi:NTE family protein
MDDVRRRAGSLPPTRATSLFARTVYRELRRANYEKADLVRFVAELMELVSSRNGAVEGELARRVDGVIDPETGLPNATVVDECVEFELRQVHESPTPRLLLVEIELSVPDWCPNDVLSRLHVRTAGTLRQSLRDHDSVYRVAPTRYLVVLPNAALDAIPMLRQRFGRVLYPRRRGVDDEHLPPGTEYGARWAAWHPGIATAALLREACASAALVALERPSAADSTAPSPVAHVSPSAKTGSRARVVAPVRTPSRTSLPGVVVALGGGAVRASAHVGVLRVLQSAGIEICGVAGTSAGALVGAMYLSGQSFEEILDRFESFVATPCYRQMRRAYAAHLRQSKRSRGTGRYFRESGIALFADDAVAAIDGELYDAFIEHFVPGDRDIATLSRPFAACASDLVSGRPVFLTRGPLHAALRGTCALPGLFAPQRDGARQLVDGAVLAEVPIHAARHLLPDVPVLAVHLARPERSVTSFATSAEVLVRANTLVHAELVREQLREAELLVVAPVADVGWLDFRRARRTAAAGEVAARAILPSIMRVLGGASTTAAEGEPEAVGL